MSINNDLFLDKEAMIMDNKSNLFENKSNSNPEFSVIQGNKENTTDNNEKKSKKVLDTEHKCYESQLLGLTFKTTGELFHGFNTIKVITFSYDIDFIDTIMDFFDYGEIILGADFLVQKDNKMNEFLAEVYANSFEAGKAIRTHKKLAVRMANGDLVFRTPTFVMDHRKIYLLKADNGKTRVIKSSANASGGAWNGDHMEYYEYDDSPRCYEEIEKDFETAWENSEEIPSSVISMKKTEDLIEGNPIIKNAKETGRTIVLKQPELPFEFTQIKYAIDHEALKEDYKTLISGLNAKSKKGVVEIIPKTIEKIQHNYKKMQQKKIEIKQVTERYPVMTFDFETNEVKMNDETLDLHPSDDEVRHDIDAMLEIFKNFDEFVGDNEKFKEAHFKLINAMFSSPFNAKIRCTAKIKDIGTMSLPLFLLVASRTANSGKTFMISAALKMMTGKELSSDNKENCKKGDIRNIQVGCKGVPVFIDELDNKYLSNIKDIIKNSDKCEDEQLEEQPMIIFASNDVLEPDETIRKRMVFLRFDGALPSSVDQSAYKSRGNAIIKRLGNGFYREYLRRMMSSVKKILDYMIYEKDIPDTWYPDLMTVSSDTILSILTDYNYDIPSYMRHLTWNDDYSVNAKFIVDNTIQEIKQFYKANKKAFVIGKESVTIELGNDKDSGKKCESWINTLPPEMRARRASTRDCHKIIVDRAELEKSFGFKFGFSLFSRR